MTIKNYGVAVSRYLDPDLRSFENAVFQAGKPVTDAELNLNEDLATTAQRRGLLKGACSGWLSDDFLKASGASTAAIFTYNASDQNRVHCPGPLYANVNGWVITINNTNEDDENQIELTAPPAGSGTQRTDFVVLEVWRKLLSASPSADGKSTLGRIWLNGNVKVKSASDLTLNLEDDILDTNVGSETTKRVQIQYRLRVISGVDLFSYPFGMDDPTIVANSVPTNAGTPDGSVTAFPYVNQSTNGDSGLWIAGDGDPSNTLGTVDGYMYAIPLMGVTRLNTAAFDKNSNQRGSSVTPPTASDRPDFLDTSTDYIYPQVVNARDIIDLRQGVSLSGWNYKEILDKNLTYLLDNSLRTELETTSSGGGFSGHTVLSCDEVGLLPGNSVTTGDTPGGTFIGQFDSVRRRVSDRPLYEVLTVKKSPAGANWANGESVTIDPSSLAVYPSVSTFSFSARAPSGTVLIDYLNARHIGPGGGKVSRDAIIDTVTGLGSGTVTVTLGNVVAGVTNEPLYIDLLVAIPPGQGLTKTPDKFYTITVNNAGALPGDFDDFSVDLEDVDATHREKEIQYETTSGSFTLSAEGSGATAVVRLPERALNISEITVNATPRGFTLDTTGRVVTLVSLTAPGDVIVVTGTWERPLPQNAAQVSLWYSSRAPQTIRSAILGTDISVIPRYISEKLITLTTGSGSQGEAFPFPVAYAQTGGVFPTSLVPFDGEHQLDGDATIAIANFNATTGMLRLPTLVEYSPNPDEVSFTRDPGDTDIENRTYFPEGGGGYDPSAYAQPLTSPVRHKVFLPMLVETAEDSSIGPKGMLLLGLVLRWASFDAENNVAFDPNQTVNSTSVSFYRVKGNLLNRGV